MLSCFQAMEMASSVQGMPTWMPSSFSVGKSIATWSRQIGLPTEGSRRSFEYTRLCPICIMIGMSSSLQRA